MSFLKETRKTKKKQKKVHGPVSACARRGKKKKREIRQSGARKVTAVKSQHAIQIYGGYTDTRCQERTRWHDATVTYTPRPGFIHHPVEMQFPLFLPEKLLGPSPRHVPQIKPATPPLHPRMHPTSESLLARTRVVVYSFETVLGMAGDPEKSFHIAISLISREYEDRVVLKRETTLFVWDRGREN